MTTYKQLLEKLQTLSEDQLAEKVQVCDADDNFCYLAETPWGEGPEDFEDEEFSSFCLYLED